MKSTEDQPEPTLGRCVLAIVHPFAAAAFLIAFASVIPLLVKS